MQCHQARQLFDAYLDGELSEALATELGAHRIRCANCRRELALLEVAGHIVHSDREVPTAPSDFTDRLLACVDGPRRRWQRIRLGLYVGGPAAAAAVIALAFLGFFDDGRRSVVAGREEVRPGAALPAAAKVVPATDGSSAAHSLDEHQAIQNYLRRARQSGESLQYILDSSLNQMLEVLDEADPNDAAHPNSTDVPDQEPPSSNESPPTSSPQAD